MRINHNIQALNTYRQLSVNQNNLSKHLERLSSGLRINRASDDAAGLAISEKMRSQIRGLKVADRNALDGISMIQTAEGALGEVQSILQRMRELSVQAANGAMSSTDRQTIQDEIDQLTFEIDRISETTRFNGKSLLGGNLDGNAYIATSSSQIVYDDVVDNAFEGTIPANEEVYISFIDTPQAGDSLTIDNPGLVIDFVSSATPGPTEVNVTGNSIENIISDIATIINNNVGAVPNLSSFTIMGNAIVFKADTGGLDISAYDPDYQPKPDEPLKMTMHLGANKDEVIDISITNMGAASLGLARMADHTTVITTPGTKALGGVDVSSTSTAASDAISIIDKAIEMVTLQRSTLGAYQNRLELTVRNLGTATENLTAAESRIRDADMAIEMTGFTKVNIINQAATAMLAQANQMPQGVLQLLQ